MTILSNTNIATVRDQVRVHALTSFEFFANHVLALNLPSELCSEVKDVLEDEEDYIVHTDRPRSLAVALRSWLENKGISVLSTIPLPQLEVLDWLGFENDTHRTQGVSLDVQGNSVGITWL